MIFVDGAYWVIEDVLTGERATATTCASTSPRRATTARSRCTITGARGIALEDGWISPQYGIRDARAGRQRGGELGERAHFVTLLAPDERTLERDGDTLRIGSDTLVLGERVTRR